MGIFALAIRNFFSYSHCLNHLHSLVGSRFHTGRREIVTDSVKRDYFNFTISWTRTNRIPKFSSTNKIKARTSSHKNI